MGLAYAWQAKEHHVLAVFQGAHDGQFIDLAFINRWLEGEIKIVQGLLNGEAGHLEDFQVFSQPVHGKFRHTAPRHIWTNWMASTGNQ